MEPHVIKVLIVDDSAFVRKVVREMLSTSPQIEIVGTARNGEDALSAVETLQPDVITCDLVMPEMDGVAFVKAQMKRKPVPILILTASPQDADQVLEALQHGAVDFVKKPSALASDNIFAIREELIGAVKAADQARTRFASPSLKEVPTPVPSPTATAATGRKADIVLLGISTGGPQALRYLIPQFPADFPVPIVMVLHMPVGYTAMFAEKLAELSKLRVQEAYEGCPVRAGEVLLAPAGKHLTFARQTNGEVITQLSHMPLDKPHRPSVDVLFQSAAGVFGGRVLGVVMTGMGNDGMQGAAWIKSQGGMILTEAEETCIIYGMPRSVVESGLSDHAVPLTSMAQEINKHL